MRPGSTLFELGVVLAIIGIVAGMAFPRLAMVRDQAAVRAGATSTVALLSIARRAAIRRGVVTAVTFDSITGTITVFAGRDTIVRRPLGEIHGVSLSVSRDSISYAPNGMGFGAANTRIVVARGQALDTITTSRLGRVRR
jgi:Tfp pilus assembly protein FimT